MKQTVIDLFPPEDEYAYFMLVWGSRAETPQELAARQWATMRALDAVVPAGDPRYPAPKWVDPNEDLYSRYRPPTPDSLEELQEQVARNAQVHEDGTVQGRAPLTAFLAPDGEHGTIVSIEGAAGHRKTASGNDVMIRFQPDFPIGDSHDAADLFRKLVGIWQPDWARFGTLRTSQQVEDYAKSYASYLSWVAQPSMGVPPALQSAIAEPFGDGTLLAVKDWSIDGVRNLHEELLAAGVPGKVADNREPQVVPQFPSDLS
ncbi:hypothetical protein LJ754_03115 [Arthrobacter sp. zg-Y40]|uniref:hypothetical protein n=1 Tax=Arthrobacter sp. zg-Y40 TaxID=2886939 RepID=UPI001D14590E|nr:hypothetical protein [Arthrobacter sp. zg-Y40]MCC3278150.1 hypothetical protein [Arthrobacter sp. zg-Y40]